MDLLDTSYEKGLHIDERSSVHLKETTGWSKYLAIAGMILAVLAVVFSFALGARIENALNSGFMNSGAAGFLVILFVLIFAVAYFTLSYFLYRFAVKMKEALDTADKYEFVNAMRNLRNTYRIMGILISLYVLLFFLNSLAEFIQIF